ncbi:deaminase [Vibrio coralliilyticus]|uniref:Deaminase n=2 Tax=Vibrionaceae TaxID=641 RepID=A0A0A0T2B8_9VIBR|nr:MULTISPECIES: deaminase [Vibrio]EEX32484.1 putative deaminase [Vibrio coralliilyticus ATCC BAA-450]ERB62189.1 deaminase [Vibrio coralliilyticus OCN008]KFI11812.1 deaminase [Vibrio sp. B183]AIW20774.1 deaminase [Vibrio coralliilyticus]ANW26822.1 tRNA-specific adenosine deaminase [Vibrio coralliilyticus]
MCKSKIENMDTLLDGLVNYSVDHVHQGGIPFTAYVVNSKGEVLGKGVNRVLENHDPTAHAEVEAIRDACRNTKSSHLRGLTLLASGEPCAMCYLNALFAGISEVVYVADRDEAARHGFDYRNSYSALAGFPENWGMLVRKQSTENALEPFKLLQSKRKF